MTSGPALRRPVAETRAVVSTNGSWWTQARSREEFRQAVDSELPRMASSSIARHMNVRLLGDFTE